MSDRYGRRPALVVGSLGFAAASLAGALSGSAALVLWRVAMGVFAARDLPHHALDPQQHLPGPP